MLGSDDSTTFVIRHDLAQIILRQERQSEAERLFRDLLEDERRLLGEDHFLTVATRNFNDGSLMTNSSLSRPELREDHAFRLLNRAVRLDQQKQPNQAIEIYQQLIDRYGNDPDPALAELVARALLYQGETLAGPEASSRGAQRY